MDNKKIFQISIQINSGSVGRIAEQIGISVLDKGWESFITYSRKCLNTRSQAIKIGNKWDLYSHVIKTRLLDDHGMGSKRATTQLIKTIERINPEIIHLHNVHGYFLNIEILFEFLNRFGKPVVWTVHDCWSFTGHCTYYEYVGCKKWQTECHSCPQLGEYPKTWFFDHSRRNFRLKRKLFTLIDRSNLILVPVSFWLGNQLKKSFLSDYRIEVIQNGIDLNTFDIQTSGKIYNFYKALNKRVLLGVANLWDDRKGLSYFIELSKLVSEQYQIVLVGLSSKQIKALPKNIIGIERTEDLQELVELYSVASVFINPTLEDTFPTTNLESLACGTPIVTFRSGGSVESVCSETGFVVDKGDTKQLFQRVEEIVVKGKKYYSSKCRAKAVRLYDREEKFRKYIDVYQSLLN